MKGDIIEFLKVEKNRGVTEGVTSSFYIIDCIVDLGGRAARYSFQVKTFQEVRDIITWLKVPEKFLNF